MHNINLYITIKSLRASIPTDASKKCHKKSPSLGRAFNHNFNTLFQLLSTCFVKAISKVNLVNLNAILFCLKSTASFVEPNRWLAFSGHQPAMHEPPQCSSKYLKLTQTPFLRYLFYFSILIF